MPRRAKELKALAVSRLKCEGGKVTRHAVGGVAGLYLVCAESGAKSWILRVPIGTRINAKGEEVSHRHDIGLGAYPEVTLAMAREDASRMKRRIIDEGFNPIADRKARRSAVIAQNDKMVTFRDVAEDYIRKKSKEYKSEKQRYKLRQQLNDYAFPYIGNLVVGDIGVNDIVRVLSPIREKKRETADRVRIHIKKVLDRAAALELRFGENPARKEVIDEIMPVLNKPAKRKHRKAMAVDDLPNFYAELKADESLKAKALRFMILTTTRPGEVVYVANSATSGARWEEIDLRKKAWTIPAERMKSEKAHTVPLCDEAVALLKSVPKMGEFIFPSPQKESQPISDTSVRKLTPDDVDMHGFRATFRTWAQEHTNYHDEVPELQLAHVNSDATRAAYARSQLIDKRRELMADWEHFVLHGHKKRKAKVVNLR